VGQVRVGRVRVGRVRAARSELAAQARRLAEAEPRVPAVPVPRAGAPAMLAGRSPLQGETVPVERP